MTSLPVNHQGGELNVEGPDLLSLTTCHREGNLVIEVTGEIDLAAAPLLEQALADALRHPAHQAVVIDLHAVDFMDSTGLAVLLHASEQLRRAGRSLILVRPSPSVTRTLQLAGLLSMFEVRDSAFGPAPRDELCRGTERGK